MRVASCGSWELKDEFLFCQRDSSLMLILPKVISPQEIVHRAKGDIFCHLNDDNNSSAENEDDINAYNFLNVLQAQPISIIIFKHHSLQFCTMCVALLVQKL